ncbi:hypothetical protein B0H14DRAFT_2969518 [Mycena olivaceomarginata]|nr:hypothetical protein B0H14DRAFT_2969518 [Mycena olivaceomarginata]
MFSKLSVATLAAATPTGTPPPPVTTPNSPQCCASVVPSTSSAACSPITVAETTGTHGSTTVTCDAPQNEWGGLIAINCLPITPLEWKGFRC